VSAANNNTAADKQQQHCCCETQSICLSYSPDFIQVTKSSILLDGNPVKMFQNYVPVHAFLDANPIGAERRKPPTGVAIVAQAYR
jgi:hypothetical protein